MGLSGDTPIFFLIFVRFLSVKVEIFFAAVRLGSAAFFISLQAEPTNQNEPIMDVTTILNIIFGGTSLVSVIGMILYYRENKKLKQNEVKVSDVETQKQQIDLVVYFKDQVLKVLEDVQKAQHAGNDNQVQIMRKIDKVEDKVGDIETYLNGPYHQWLSEKEKGVADV